jgi:transcriptional regulator
MYTPRPFAVGEGDLGQLHDLIEADRFGILVASGADDQALEATHLPFLLDRSRGERGTLMTHAARANPIWQRLAAGQEALVIFSGPHSYVSPDWYAGDGLVPTWNYVAVHAYGRARIIDDPAASERHLRALVATMEAGLEPKPPWQLDRITAKTRASLLRAIVAFEIEITALQGKRKLNQNRSRADRAGVVEALAAADDQGGRRIATLMRALDTA